MAALLLAAAAPAPCAFASNLSARDPSQLTPAQIMQYIEEQKARAAAGKGSDTSSTPSTSAPPMLLEPSGRPWCLRFMPSLRVEDLAEPFRSNVKRFIAALEQAGMRVVITTTYRPQERSYLMHYSLQIARDKERPASVPAWRGVNIDWSHRDRDRLKADLAKAKSAARDMVSGYGISSVPVSRPGRSAHNFSQAIDMVITGYAGKTIVDAQKKTRTVQNFIDLKSVGASYGVIWYGPEDSVHWSVDGN
jgi:hypothetical protein